MVVVLVAGVDELTMVVASTYVVVVVVEVVVGVVVVVVAVVAVCRTFVVVIPLLGFHVVMDFAFAVESTC